MVLSDKLIEQIFSTTNARRGKQLYDVGAVYDIEDLSTERQLHFEALVSDGYEEEATTIMIDMNATALRSRCTCDEGRMCAHLAALMYAISAEVMGMINQTPLSPEEMQRQQLNETLHNYTVAQLRAIAKRQGWKPKGTRKDAILEQVADHILSELEAGTFLDGLAPSQAEMLAALHLAYDINQGVTTADVMNVNNKLLNKRSDWNNTLSGLVEYGVIYRDKETYEDETLYRSVVRISSFAIPAALYKLPAHRANRYPRSKAKESATPLTVAVMQLCQYLSDGRILLPNPPDWEPPNENTEAPWISEWPSRGDEVNELQDETPFFYLLQQQYLTLPINHYVLHPESRQSLSVLLGSVDKAEWLVDLLRISGLLTELESDAGLVLNSERYEMWAQLDPEAQLRLFHTAWQTLGSEFFEMRMLVRNAPRWELWRAVHPGLYYALFMNDIAGGRSTVMRFLAQIAKQRMNSNADWVNLDTFIKKISQVRPDFYHTVAGPEAWGFKRNNDRIPYTNSRYWHETYGQLVQALFEGPLFWMGAVELLERKGKATAFRLTPLGRWILNPTQQLADVLSADSQEPTQLAWTDADTVKIIPGSDLGNILNVLNRYTSQVERKPNHYQLDNARLEKAFADGETADVVVTAFEAIGVPFSAETKTRVRLIHQRYGSVHLYEDLTVIEFSDDYALAELRAGKIIDAESIIHEFSPRLIVIHDVHVDKITKALQKKNYTPKIV